jgi:type VI secretion system protein ImpB
MSGNSQKQLRQVRKPRVHITLDIDTEGQLKKELPFVIGVLGDFSGNPRQPLQPFAERGFVTIDRDSFDKVMARMTPGLTLMVDDKLSNDKLANEVPKVQIDLAFNKLEDFEPARIAAQVPQLKALMETRAKLLDLMTKADRSETLETLLEQILLRDGDRKALAQELGPTPGKE